MIRTAAIRAGASRLPFTYACAKSTKRAQSFARQDAHQFCDAHDSTFVLALHLAIHAFFLPLEDKVDLVLVRFSIPRRRCICQRSADRPRNQLDMTYCLEDASASVNGEMACLFIFVIYDTHFRLFQREEEEFDASQNSASNTLNFNRLDLKLGRRYNCTDLPRRKRSHLNNYIQKARERRSRLRDNSQIDIGR